MKLTITLTVLFYLIVDPIHIRAGNQGIQFVNDSPSELFVSGDPQKHGAAMVVMLQHKDLREIYCKDEVLQRRQINKLAVLDRLNKSFEVPVGNSETVESFLVRSGMADLWRTSWQPQVRLITRDAICQSPGEFNDELTAAFKKRPVTPGDIVVVTLVD